MLRCLDPLVPASMHMLPQRYDIVNRLWETAFHLLLERLRHALQRGGTSELSRSREATSVQMEVAKSTATRNMLLEHFTEFIYFAYSFYTHILEDHSLGVFSSAWLEQLGDIARYRMFVAGQVAASIDSAAVITANTHAGTSLPLMSSASPAKTMSVLQLPKRQLYKGQSRQPVRIDDDDLEDADTPGGDSIGVAALDDWHLEEQEVWRRTAKDWYNKGLAETPGTGRLHHHLALLCKNDALRSLYHFAKRLGLLTWYRSRVT